jgi:hypothetical protein
MVKRGSAGYNSPSKQEDRNKVTVQSSLTSDLVNLLGRDYLLSYLNFLPKLLSLLPAVSLPNLDPSPNSVILKNPFYNNKSLRP